MAVGGPNACTHAHPFYRLKVEQIIRTQPQRNRSNLMTQFQNETLIPLVEGNETVIDLVSPIQPRIERSLFDLTDCNGLSPLNIDNHFALSNSMKNSPSPLRSKEESSPDKIDEVIVLEGETAARRHEREMAASEELARQLMAEEAIESYRQSASFLQDHTSDYSKEDLAMIQAAMGYDMALQGSVDYDEHDDYNEEEEEDDDEEEDSSSPASDMSYDTLLRLGEQIGDVKMERWALRAKFEISKLPIVRFSSHFGTIDENETRQKCLICQLQYEPIEELRQLPCGHYFHRGCVDQWLMTKDLCPCCRQPIH